MTFVIFYCDAWYVSYFENYHIIQPVKQERGDE